MSGDGADRSNEGEKVQTDRRKLIKQAERDPRNRLVSIIEDAAWVAAFCRDELPSDLPIVPNLRCGAWYVPARSDRAVDGCYFKSTDGHTHEWAFSLKRYNVQLLELVLQRGGCIVVDSTRRGKSMPDALSKTVPIWCAVINEVVKRKNAAWGSNPWAGLATPPFMVGPSEHAQIEERVPEWTRQLLQSSLSVPELRKPLRPVFLTRHNRDETITQLRSSSSADLPFYPIVLVSASAKVTSPSLEPRALQPNVASTLAHVVSDDSARLLDKASFIYVQGSGDDEEAWSQGLTPELFWRSENMHAILARGASKEALKDCLAQISLRKRIDSLSIEDGEAKDDGGASSDDIRLGSLPIFLGKRNRTHVFTAGEDAKYGLVLHVDGTELEANDENGQEKSSVIRLGVESGKRGLKAFRECLPQCRSLAKHALPGPILVCSAEDGVGNDLVAGIVIAILAECFDDDLHSRRQDEVPALTKDDIRRRMQWLTSQLPALKLPSRAHMLRINEALLSPAFRAEAASKTAHQLSSSAVASEASSITVDGRAYLH